MKAQRLIGNLMFNIIPIDSRREYSEFHWFRLERFRFSDGDGMNGFGLQIGHVGIGMWIREGESHESTDKI